MKKLKLKKKKIIIISCLVLATVLVAGYFTYKRMGIVMNKVHLECTNQYPAVDINRYYQTADYKWKGTTKIKSTFILRFTDKSFEEKVPTHYANPLEHASKKYLIFIYNTNDTIIINRYDLFMHKFIKRNSKQIMKAIFKDKYGKKDSHIDDYLKEVGTPEEIYSYKIYQKKRDEWHKIKLNDDYVDLVPKILYSKPNEWTTESYGKWETAEWKARFPYWSNRGTPTAYLYQIEMYQCKKTRPIKIERKI